MHEERSLEIQKTRVGYHRIFALSTKSIYSSYVIWTCSYADSRQIKLCRFNRTFILRANACAYVCRCDVYMCKCMCRGDLHLLFSLPLVEDMRRLCRRILYTRPPSSSMVAEVSFNKTGKRKVSKLWQWNMFDGTVSRPAAQLVSSFLKFPCFQVLVERRGLGSGTKEGLVEHSQVAQPQWCSGSFGELVSKALTKVMHLHSCLFVNTYLVLIQTVLCSLHSRG